MNDFKNTIFELEKIPNYYYNQNTNSICVDDHAHLLTLIFKFFIITYI